MNDYLTELEKRENVACVWVKSKPLGNIMTSGHFLLDDKIFVYADMISIRAAEWEIFKGRIIKIDSWYHSRLGNLINKHYTK